MHMALKKNLDVTIHEAFLEEILQSNWKPGQALNLDELAERYGVMTIPTVIAVKNGQPAKKSIGVQPKAALKSLLD